MTKILYGKKGQYLTPEAHQKRIDLFNSPEMQAKLRASRKYKFAKIEKSLEVMRTIISDIPDITICELGDKYQEIMGPTKYATFYHNFRKLDLKLKNSKKGSVEEVKAKGAQSQ